MTDLTDKWKKGELPEGVYCFKLPNGEIDIGTDFKLAKLLMCKDGDKIEVLEKVTSYKRWELLNWFAGNGIEENQELKMENAKLKKILKECAPYVNHGFMETREFLTKPYTASDKVLHKKAEKLLTKIDEVLK